MVRYLNETNKCTEKTSPSFTFHSVASIASLSSFRESGEAPAAAAAAAATSEGGWAEDMR